MSLISWLQNKMLGKRTITISSDDLASYVQSTSEGSELTEYVFALNSAINIIANALSRCEFRTFVSGHEVKGDQYYLWNYQPNFNQNASQFRQKLVWSLIFNGDCLVVPGSNGTLHIADSYTRTSYAMMPDTFDNVTITPPGGSSFTFSKSFSMKDVLYFRLSNVNISALVRELCSKYEDLLACAVKKFYRSGGERGILSIDGSQTTATFGTNDDGTPRTFNQVFNELMNNQFKNYFDNPNAVMVMWRGFNYQKQDSESTKKSTSEVKDVTDITDQIYDRVATALQIPPALLRGDVADVTSLTKNLITFAIDPIATMIEREINRKQYGKSVLAGSYLMVDTSSIMHVEPFEAAANAFNLLGVGYSVDEVRKKFGDAPLGEDWSDKHYISKNFENLEGTDENQVPLSADGAGAGGTAGPAET